MIPTTRPSRRILSNHTETPYRGAGENSLSGETRPNQTWSEWFDSKPLAVRWLLSLVAIAVAQPLFMLISFSWEVEEGLEPGFVTYARNVVIYTLAGMASRVITYALIARLVPKPLLIGGLVAALDALFLLVVALGVILWATTDASTSPEWREVATYVPVGITSLYMFAVLRRDTRRSKDSE